LQTPLEVIILCYQEHIICFSWLQVFKKWSKGIFQSSYNVIKKTQYDSPFPLWTRNSMNLSDLIRGPHMELGRGPRSVATVEASPVQSYHKW